MGDVNLALWEKIRRAREEAQSSCPQGSRVDVVAHMADGATMYVDSVAPRGDGWWWVASYSRDLVDVPATISYVPGSAFLRIAILTVPDRLGRTIGFTVDEQV